MPAKRDMPEWWEWELDCSLPHLRKRMLVYNEQIVLVVTAYKVEP